MVAVAVAGGRGSGAGRTLARVATAGMAVLAGASVALPRPDGEVVVRSAAGEGGGGAVVALRTEGSIAVLDDRGATQRVLTRAGSGEELGGLALSPDGRSVYYHRVAGDSWCDLSMVIETVPLAGGRPRTVAAGAWPAPSPDGRSLSYSGAPMCEPTPGGIRVTHRLVVADLDGSAAREWTWVEPESISSDDEPGWPTASTWSPDGRRLAYLRNFAGGDGSALWVLDAQSPGGPLGGDRLGPGDAEASWWAPVFAADGSVLVVEPRYDEAAGALRTRIVAVDPSDGASRVVFERAGAVHHLGLDPSSAEGVALLVVEEAQGGLPALYRLEGGVRSERLAEGVLEAIGVSAPPP